MSRILITAYGVLAYALFLAVFAYLAGFLLELHVPKTINAPVPGAAPFAIWINLGLIALFGVTHSMMARDWFKRALTRIIPEEAERSTYVLQSSLCLALAMWQWRAIETTIWQVEGPAAVLFYALFALGTGILLLGTFLIDHFELFGLRQIWSNLRSEPMPKPEFKTPLLYRFVRHPMQLGVIILLFSTPHMTVGHLLFAGAMTAYIFVGLHFEERALVRQFGNRYRAYQSEVPLLFPRVRAVYREYPKV